VDMLDVLQRYEVRMEQKEKPKKRRLLAVLFGLLVALALYYFINDVFYAILAGIGGYILMRVFVSRLNRKREVEETTHGLTKSVIRETLEEGKSTLKELRSYSYRVRNREVKEKIEGICVVVDKIFDDFKKNPKDIKRARQFLSYYLDATLKIIRKYVELSAREVISEEVKTSLQRVESMLDTIKNAFEVQYANLLKDDVLDLDTEIDLLKNMIKMEGLEVKQE
jgi:5-bromo-4-chloroindolyl phosphate hydrolysis protein